MKQINPSNLTMFVDKQSQHDPHAANHFYCEFSPNESNGEIYWTFNTSVHVGDYYQYRWI